MRTVDSKAAGPDAGAPHASARATAPAEIGREKMCAGRPPSETATLVCAVSLAVALGVACGAWINARLASAAAASSSASAVVTRLLPAERADARNAAEPPAVTQPTPVEHQDASAEADETSPSDGSPDAESPRTDAERASDKVNAESRRGPTPSGVEASPPAKAFGTRGGAAGVVEKDGGAPGRGRKATAGRGRVSPCALYASTNSLTVRGGGAATLILGGPGEAGRVTVSTPNWSDIAVFPEGRVGDRGWARYSVRSVSKRAGVYAVRFTTPCGSHTIPVTVTRH